jgi:hypothetical protein
MILLLLIGMLAAERSKPPHQRLISPDNQQLKLR